MDTSFGAPFVLIAVLGLFAAVYLGLWIWSLVHCITNRYLTDNNRLIGIILIALLGLLGSLVYLFLPREADAQR